MKEITNKILSKLISFDNCINRHNEDQRLNEIIALCEEYMGGDIITYARISRL